MKRYKHYKGGIYLYLGEGRHTETFEQCVVYMSVKNGDIWFRPKEMFYGTVEVDGKIVPRFEELSSCFEFGVVD